MTQDELVEFIGSLPGVVTTVASADNGAPEESWGDVFFSVAGPQFPFVTLVKRDQPGDNTSKLDREGVFRLNVNIGRKALADRFPEGTNHDPAALDQLFPHPVYAAYGFVSVLNPQATASEIRDLLREAHARATRRKIV